MVLLKDGFLKQRDWPLAKVIRIHPGDDGLIRTADLLCQNHEYRRATIRLILITEDQPLPPVYLCLTRQSQWILVGTGHLSKSKGQSATSITFVYDSTLPLIKHFHIWTYTLHAHVILNHRKVSLVLSYLCSHHFTKYDV